MKFLILVKEDKARQIDYIAEASCAQYLNGYHKLFELDSILNSAKEIGFPILKTDGYDLLP